VKNAEEVDPNPGWDAKNSDKDMRRVKSTRLGIGEQGCPAENVRIPGRNFKVTPRLKD
jgi:hypothetical protein